MSTRENPEDKPVNYFIVGGICLTAAVFFLRIHPPTGLGLFGAALLLLGFGGYQYFRSTGFAGKKTMGANKNTFAGRIESRLLECRAREEQFRNESHFIRDRIQGLREDLQRSAKADESEKARAQVLIKEFEAEFDLRHAKVSFFSECAERLEELLARHRLHQSINDRKKELEQLRQSNFDDEATMEETRYHLEQDTIQLDTIAELTQDATVSFKAEQAEELRQRLEKLRSSLGGSNEEPAK